MIRNKAGQKVDCDLIDLTTGLAFTGIATVYVKGDAGPLTIGSVGGGTIAPDGTGLFTYFPSQAETNYVSVTFQFRGVNAIGQARQFDTLLQAQQNAIQALTGVGAVDALVIVSDALAELNVFGVGDGIPPDDATFVLGVLNRILDRWNAKRRAVFAEAITRYVLTPGLSPHTIGSSGASFTVPQRPERISAANVVLNPGTAQESRSPVFVRDRAWWLSLAAPQLPVALPRALYYEPFWPNGAIFFDGVPNTAVTLELASRVVLAQLGLHDVFTLPPGYRDALTLTLEENIAHTYEAEVTDELRTNARQARAEISAANDEVPKLRTRDSGMPSEGCRGGFDYRTRRIG